LKKRKGTEDEINFLKDNVGIIKVPTIAEKLERTEEAVVIKMKRLGMGNTRNQEGYLNATQLARILNVDPKTVKLWINNHGLKCLKKATRFEKKYYFIKPEDFWIWASENRSKVDFSKIEPRMILPEPEWFIEESRITRDVNYKVWTVKEERKLLMMMTDGTSPKEVAKQLNRSIISVKRKYNRLKIN